MSQRNQMSEITSRELEELLQRHADALAGGRDILPELLNQNPESATALTRLLGLNQRLSESLAPVEPSAGFVDNLRARLAEAHGIAVQEQERHARNMRATIGTGVVAVIIVALVARLIGSVVMVISVLVRKRHGKAAT